MIFSILKNRQRKILRCWYIAVPPVAPVLLAGSLASAQLPSIPAGYVDASTNGNDCSLYNTYRSQTGDRFCSTNPYKGPFIWVGEGARNFTPSGFIGFIPLVTSGGH